MDSNLKLLVYGLILFALSSLALAEEVNCNSLLAEAEWNYEHSHPVSLIEENQNSLKQIFSEIKTDPHQSPERSRARDAMSLRALSLQTRLAELTAQYMASQFKNEELEALSVEILELKYDLEALKSSYVINI